MDMSFEDLVRERAYHIWLAGGMADGQAHEHWAMAEQAVKTTPAEPVVIITKPAKAAAAKSATAKPAAKRAVKPAAAKAKASKPAKTAAH